MTERSMQAVAGCARRAGCGGALLLAVAVAVLVPAFGAESQEAVAPTAAPRPPVTRNGAVPTLDRRLQALTRELGLNSAQQAMIRQILEAQRDAVHNIWVDPAVPPVERAAATQAQTERTGDEIRAVLNEDQKKIYSRSRKDNPLPPEQRRSVEQWMDASKAPKAGTP